MGTSTDAYLYYGFSLDEGELEEICEKDTGKDYFEDDFEEWLCGKIGGPSRLDVEYEGNEAVYEKYLDEKREFMEALDVEIKSHCSCDYPIYFVHIKESYSWAWRGEPHRFGTQLPVTNPGWDEKIKEFCKKLYIPFREPGWELASMWC